MPRFGLKTLLIMFAVIGLWLSTFSGYGAGRDVRAIILLVIFLASGLAALYCRGRRRAFWIGFFALMLTVGVGLTKEFVPNFMWVSWSEEQKLRQQLTQVQANFYLLRDTSRAVSWLALGTLVGYISVRIYDDNQTDE